MTEALPFSSWKRMFFLSSISAVTLLIVLDYSIANIALPYISGGLAVSIEEGVYVITFFSIGNAIGLALTGWLTRKIGQIRLILLSIALFTFFSWLCGLSATLVILVIARFLQGLVSGPMLPLSQAILIKEAKPTEQTRDISIWSTVVITGPVLGPLLGGYISYWYHWSWIFYINIPVGIACFFIIFWLLKDRETPIEKVSNDFCGIFLLSIAVTSFQIFLDKGQQWDWWNSIRIRSAFFTCVISTIFFILRELRISQPFFQVRLLKNFSFTLAVVLLIVSYGIYFGSIVVVPLWLNEFMDYDVITAGIAVAPLGIGPIALSLLAPKIINKIGNLLTVALSFTAFGISAFYTSFFLTSIDLVHIGFARFLMGLGFTCYITPLIQISIQNIAPSNLSSAVGIFHFFRALSGAIGASVFTTIWERRTIFHHQRVGSLLTPFNPLTPEARSLPSLQLLNNALDRQAAMLAINEVFYLMGWLFAISIVVIMAYHMWGIMTSSFGKRGI